MSCSESVAARSRRVPRSTTMIGHGPLDVVLARPGRLHVGFDELDLDPRRERLVLLDALVLAAQHSSLPLEVDDRDVLLQAAHDLLRLVGEAVALALGQVPGLACGAR